MQLRMCDPFGAANIIDKIPKVYFVKYREFTLARTSDRP